MTTTSDSDITGWCARKTHESCSGILRAGTEYHWWCACHCHPTPVAVGDDALKALAVWKKARDAHA